MRASPSRSILAVSVALLASACSAAVVSPSPTAGPSSVPLAAIVAQPTAALSPTPLATPPSPTPAPVAGALAPKVIGTGSYPGVTVVAPGWHLNGDFFVDKTSGPLLGISVWDVGKVPRDPCHWLGQLYDPGPTVDNLVRALVAQRLRHASKPTSVTLAGYSGQYFEWSVPGNMVVTGDSDFKGCDVQPSNGHLDYVSWQGSGMGERYQQVAGQVDRLWVLDVKGQRLLVDATHTPEATPADLAEQEQIVQSLRFSVMASGVSNGWIAYSTDGQLPGATDDTTGSDIYLVRQGGNPTLIAGRDGGTTRNVCPAFSPDGRRLAFGVDGAQGRAVVVLEVDANGVTGAPVRITVPGPGPGVCVRWSSDGTHLAYLDGGVVVVRGLDGSTRASVAGDPGAGDFAPAPQWSDPVLSPSREWSVRLTDSGIVVAHPDGTFAHIIPLTYSPYSIATWSPDGRQVLLMEDVSGHDFTMHAIAVDSDFTTTIVSKVRTNGARSWPGLGEVSWQPVFP